MTVNIQIINDNRVIAAGDFGYSLVTGVVAAGDGVTAFNSLSGWSLSIGTGYNIWRGNEAQFWAIDHDSDTLYFVDDYWSGNFLAIYQGDYRWYRHDYPNEKPKSFWWHAAGLNAVDPLPVNSLIIQSGHTLAVNAGGTSADPRLGESFSGIDRKKCVTFDFNGGAAAAFHTYNAEAFSHPLVYGEIWFRHTPKTGAGSSTNGVQTGSIPWYGTSGVDVDTALHIQVTEDRMYQQNFLDGVGADYSPAYYNYTDHGAVPMGIRWAINYITGEGVMQDPDGSLHKITSANFQTRLGYYLDTELWQTNTATNRRPEVFAAFGSDLYSATANEVAHINALLTAGGATALTAKPDITYEGDAFSQNNSITIATTAGELVLAYLINDASDTQPNTPSGWTVWDGYTGFFGTGSYKIVYKTASGTSETISSNGNTTAIAAARYKNAAVGSSYENTVNDSAPQYGPLTQLNNHPSRPESWLVAFVYSAGNRDVGAATPPSGLTYRGKSIGPTVGVAHFDSNGGLTGPKLVPVKAGSFTGGNDRWWTFLGELKKA
jgi:hypothetical protein